MRIVILIIALLFIGMLAALTVLDIIHNGVSVLDVVAILILLLFTTGIVGRFGPLLPSDRPSPDVSGPLARGGGHLVVAVVTGDGRQQDGQERVEIDISLDPEARSADRGERCRCCATLARPFHVSASIRFSDDPLSGALGDLDGDGDLAHPDSRILGDAEQRQAVVGQEREWNHSPIVAESDGNH